MADRRLLPHLADACCELLGNDDPREIRPAVRVSVAAKAEVSQNTVDRFLRGETVPRSQDLDRMVTAVADVAETKWLQPWLDAIDRAAKAAASQAGELDPDSPPGRAAAAAKRAREETERQQDSGQSRRRSG